MKLGVSGQRMTDANIVADDCLYATTSHDWIRNHRGIMNPYITFIVPSIGRVTLESALASIQRQDDDYSAVVVCDGWERTYEGDNDRMIRWIGGNDGSAGYSRNHGIAYAKQVFSPLWVGFVDDDDTISRHYTSRLREIAEQDESIDVVVFMMQYPNGDILPDPKEPILTHGNVGISFAVKAHWFPRVAFIAEDLSNPGPNGNEDINLLLQLQEAGAKIALSSAVNYFVRHDPIGL